MMLLADCKIADLVLEHVSRYLNEPEHSFSDIKEYLVNNKSLSFIYSQLNDTLLEIKTETESHVKKALEDDFYKKQINADEQQKSSEEAEQLIDKQKYSSLTRKLDSLITSKNAHESTRAMNIHSLNSLLFNSIPQQGVPKKDEKNREQKKIKQLQEFISTDEKKIFSIINSIDIYQKKLHQLDVKIKQRDAHEHGREQRKQARIGYQSSGQGLESTLSQRSSKHLGQCLEEQQRLIEQKCADLIHEATRYVYPCFIEQLTGKLRELNLSLNEQEALSIILKLMRQHTQYEQNIIAIKDELKKTKQLIAAQTRKLQQHESQLSTLQINNPKLVNSNTILEQQNKEHSLRLEQFSQLSKRFLAPTFLLLAIAFLLSIPAILTIGGIIPLFLSPTLLYALVLVPPALCVTATIGTAITSLVCYVKAQSNKTALSTNSNTINANNKLMSGNEETIKVTRELSIPLLKAQINKDESRKEQLLQDLEQSKRMAKQTQQQVQAIEPQTTNSIFSTGIKADELVTEQAVSTLINEAPALT